MTENQPSTAEWIAIGDRIRSAREAAGISVRELARRVEVSPSHVSQVERGLASFSVRALYNVVSELEISMDSLFDDAAPVAEVQLSAGDGVPGSASSSTVDTDPLVAAGVVLRSGDRPTLPLAGGTRWERLTPRQEIGAEFIEVVYPPAPNDGRDDRTVDFIQHSSREYGLIVSGNLTVQVGFETTVLEAGDSIAFDSLVPHRFWNDTPEEVRAVWFIWDSPHADVKDHQSSAPPASAHLPFAGGRGGH